MRSTLAALAAVAVIVGASSPAAAGPSYGYPTLGAPPAGANDWSCRPTARRPDPAVIVHGTFGDQKSLLDNLSLALKSDGYCVYSLDYGNRGTGRIQRSARQLRRFVDRVLASTGATKVEMVGHSQGGMMPRYYLRFLGGAAKAHALVGLAPSNHGTTLDGLFTLSSYFPGSEAFFAAWCPACEEQEAGSGFLSTLNAGRETVSGVHYTVIESANDEVVTPYTSAFLSGRNVTNILLQSQCLLDQGEHLSMAYDHIADADVLNALDPLHPVTPACTPVLPVVGG